MVRDDFSDSLVASFWICILSSDAEQMDERQQEATQGLVFVVFFTIVPKPEREFKEERFC